jgi:hypothetical protein
MTYECPGEDGFVCIGGWLYTPVNMMIFATNRKCPVCNAKPTKQDKPVGSTGSFGGSEQPPPVAATGEGAGMSDYKVLRERLRGAYYCEQSDGSSSGSLHEDALAAIESLQKQLEEARATIVAMSAAPSTVPDTVPAQPQPTPTAQERLQRLLQPMGPAGSPEPMPPGLGPTLAR